MVDITSHTTFSFAQRPTPIPGDLRINWRIAVLLLAVAKSRQERASLAKLYIISDAVKSRASKELLARVVAGDMSPLFWIIRVEPALARAVDLMVGEGLAKWIQTGGRIGVQLTAQGTAAANAVGEFEETLSEEKAIIAELAKSVTEGKVSTILATRGDPS